MRDSLDTTPASTLYLDHLVSLSLDDLLYEPKAIAGETATVEAELINLCYREYSTFTLAHKSSGAVQSAFDDFGVSLNELLAAVPALEDECRAFSRRTSSIQAARNRVMLVQEHSGKLAELLELPQLMDTCVRNGFYQEAMDLAQHVQAGANVLVRDVAGEVEAVLQMMTTQLLALLREPTKLPALVKAVGFLRRLTEDDLGLAFLHSRLYNYRAQLALADRRDPTRYIRRYIDLFREHVYDIISQYSAIFDTSHYLVSFASQCVDELLSTISSFLPLVQDAASLSSILVQLGYCALSFARVGMDFALLANASFLGVVEAAYERAVGLATDEFVARLKTFVPVGAESISFYPPIALYLNAHLEALNALRLLAPLELGAYISSLQEESLSTTSSALLKYFDETLISEAPSAPSSPRSQLLRRNTETLLAPEIRAAKRRETKRGCVKMAQIWRDEVVPVLTGGLGGIYECEVRVDIKGIREWLSRYEEAPGELRTPPGSP